MVYGIQEDGFVWELAMGFHSHSCRQRFVRFCREDESTSGEAIRDTDVLVRLKQTFARGQQQRTVKRIGCAAQRRHLWVCPETSAPPACSTEGDDDEMRGDGILAVSLARVLQAASGASSSLGATRRTDGTERLGESKVLGRKEHHGEKRSNLDGGDTQDLLT